MKGPNYENMDSLDSTEFNVFDYAEDPEALISFEMRMFKGFALFERFGIPEGKMHSCLRKIKNCYAPIPYHNFFHVTDGSSNAHDPGCHAAAAGQGRAHHQQSRPPLQY